ncbi:MAG: nicotinate-nucleotide--dimethylbenzimidazole phosphoribosyltransferase [Ruminococcus sp.]|uniref:nicotinate-nucleotide--dimethylbenzimidazole phosphoribosyltransferase n=1 Tax=Ruminococcus sp. TaxID=41978 RepID=UPI001B254B2B|nr:nicotinate-nucleotide--dimethylbenzimidazole phosphoribosyltransferase [Ruminococcus sp.]MBO7473902.1 nicotinate-nucleotide--dimethylbenzimidazole phosphoribosyltransferase [Ruminococcus sp.]
MYRINNIGPPDMVSYHAAKSRWDSIAKPLGSFGLLEEMVQKIASVQGTADVALSVRTAVVMCGDHGVVCEGVTQCGQDVTAECATAIAEGRSNINAVARAFNIDVIAVDVGIASDVDCDALVSKKVVYGTDDIALGNAMTKEQTEHAISIGMDIVKDLKKRGTKLIITGEMGIGNTTSTAAIASVILGISPEKVTGRGAGLTSEGLHKKVNVVRRAIEVNNPSADKPLELLQKLGGAEIAAMTGLFLGGAYYHVTVVVDGVISAAACAIACSVQPVCREYILASHCSGEPAGEGLLNFCGLKAPINAGLRLGEGTGGILLVPLLDGALSLYNNSHRFDDTGIERYVELK